MFPGVHVGDIGEHFHFLLELVLQETVVDADNPFDVDVADDVLHEVFRVETRLDQVDTAHEPLLRGLPLFQTDVPSRLELSQQLPDRYLVHVPQFLVEGVEHRVDVVDLLLLQVVDFREFLDLLGLHSDVVDFDAEVGEVLIDAVEFDFLGFFDEFVESGEGPLDGLDAHVVVHLLAHQSAFSVGFGFFADGEGVQFADVPEVVEDVGLVVAEVADGVFSEVGVVEGEDLQVGQPVEVEHFFEAADFVAADVEVVEGDQVVQTGLDGVDLVACDPELLQVDQAVQVLDGFHFIVAEPESFQVGQVVQALDVFDVIMGEVELLERDALVESVDFGDLIFVEPQRF